MDSMLTIAIVVFACSIVVFFSKEFGQLFKKIFTIPGMKLLLPLVIVTGLVVHFNYWVDLGLIKTQDFLLALAKELAKGFPTNIWTFYLPRLIILLFFSLVPAFLIDWWIKRKHYHAFQYAGLMICVTWLFIATLFTLNYRY